MQQFAVLTADIVGSRKIPQKDLEARMKEISTLISKRLGWTKNGFEIFRGDSFQALLAPEDGLSVALLWRSGLMATGEENRWDTRIAIGIGAVEHHGKKLAGSGGAAYHQSGSLLDQMKQQDQARIGICTEDESLNEFFRTECQLAEGLINRWTYAGAQTMFQLLLHRENQEDLAKRIGVTQPAIHKRLQAANWPAIKHWEQHYRQEIRKYLLQHSA